MTTLREFLRQNGRSDMADDITGLESALREFAEWFEAVYPTGQNVSTPGARLYGIYLHAVKALHNVPGAET